MSYSGAGRRQNLVPNYILLTLLAIFALGPILVLASNSLKDRVQLSQNSLGIATDEFHFENYPNAWTIGGFSTTVRNSSILTAGTIVAILVLGGMASYSMRQSNAPGTNFMMLYLLVTSSLPIWLYVVPLLTIWRRLGLANNLFGLIIIYVAVNAPLAIFLLRSYMLQIPPDFEDAARVDGANDWHILSKIIAPMTWPGFLTVGMLVGLRVWNEFQMAFIFLSDPNLYPVTTSFFRFTQKYGGRDWGLTSAAAMMMIIPQLIIFLSLQRRFIDGLTQGGLK